MTGRETREGEAMTNGEYGYPRLDDAVRLTATAQSPMGEEVMLPIGGGTAIDAMLVPAGHTPDRFPAYCADGRVAYGQRCWHLDVATLELSEIVAEVMHGPAAGSFPQSSPCLSVVLPGTKGPVLVDLDSVFASEEAAAMRAARIARDSIQALREREGAALARLRPVEERLAEIRAGTAGKAAGKGG